MRLNIEDPFSLGSWFAAGYADDSLAPWNERLFDMDRARTRPHCYWSWV